jgi:UDP-3-O-[3-hydroxymyristoyl] glucosamine N-acyltransferase
VTYTAEQIAEALSAELIGEPTRAIDRVMPLETASAQDIGFAESEKYRSRAEASAAGTLLVPADFTEMPGRTVLRVAAPRKAFLRLLEMFAKSEASVGIHATAVIDPSAEIGADVSIGPHVVIERGAVIGDDCRIAAGTFIGSGVRIGAQTRLGPNVCLLADVVVGCRCHIHAGSVIGGDGFGYQWWQDHHHKVPQIGTVIVEDDVEIGCNVAIDRATIGATVIGAGTKIDNLVHLAHNNHIGRNVIITAQFGTAGSVTLGDGVMTGGQAGVADHLTIGSGARIGAKSGVTSSVPANETVWGIPARPMRRILRELASLAKLPDLLKTHRAQQEQIAALQERIELLEQRKPQD